MSQPQLASSEPLVTLLLVESDPLARVVLGDYLRGCGYIVHEAHDAVAALAALREGIPGARVEVVLAEISGIGAMSGFELAHAIRDTHPDIEVILTSSEDNTAHKCHQLCEHRIIRKPFSPQDLVRQISLMRQKHRSGVTSGKK